jgi:phenylpropionate dioxygenase-like ring-hydroxylating dioxygenase large terminal subunit
MTASGELEEAPLEPYASVPEGWYCVAFSHDLAPREVRAVRYFDRELVLYRTASGVARLVDAFCPHLGAHLGHGGRVEGELLRCGFHGFCFEPHEGRCVSTSYGHKPPRAALSTYAVREMHGLVLAYFHPHDVAPTWEIPDLDIDGWSPMSTDRLELRGHPQESSENSVDLGHFTVVHDFADCRQTAPVRTDGATLTISYEIDATMRRLGLPRVSVRAAFDVFVHGLGYSLVDSRIDSLGLRSRHLVLSTPVDASHVHLRLATSQRLRWSIPGLLRVLCPISQWHYRREVEQDLAIWANKRYVARPALAKGDGPIGTYRKWCRRFYHPPRPTASGDPRRTVQLRTA